MSAHRISREMEFEFVDDADGGAFVATDHVTAVIASHLTKGDVEKAASLIATSAPEVGDKLLEEEAAAASPAFKESLAMAFARARDFTRAARAALAIGDPARAAPLFERNYEFVQAAKLYEEAGQFERAAELFERNLQYDDAARLYERAGALERAATTLEKAGRALRAGELWQRAHRLDRAVEALQRVDESSEEFPRAMFLLGRLLESAGHHQAAALRYIQVVRTHPVNDSTIDAYQRLGEIYVAAGEERAARKLLTMVLEHDPTRQAAAEALAKVGGPLEGRLSRTPPLSAGTPAAAPAEVPTSAPLTGEQPPRALDTTGDEARPLVLPSPPGRGPGASSPTGAQVTTVNRSVDQLRKLPLFAELNLDELRALEALSTKRPFRAGDILIEQDRQAQSLFMILSGTVEVVRVDEGGEETLLGEFGYGASLGEVTLVDEGPTSARVRAKTDVIALSWPLDQLRRHLAVHENTALRLLRVISRTLSIRLRETTRMASYGNIIEDGPPRA